MAISPVAFTITMMAGQQEQRQRRFCLPQMGFRDFRQRPRGRRRRLPGSNYRPHDIERQSLGGVARHRSGGIGAEILHGHRDKRGMAKVR